LDIKPVFLFVLRIVGAISLVFVVALFITSKLLYKQIVCRSSSSRFFWEIFYPALTTGLVLLVVPALLGSSDNDEFIFTDFSEFLEYTGFCTLLITAGVAVFGRHYQEAKETEKQIIESEEEAARARNRAKEEARAENKDDAKNHFELAINYLTEGEIDSALREYQIVKELDDVLAGELYDRIFSAEEIK
jgi:hypothetical protein